MKKKLFSHKELEQLPLNCSLFTVNEASGLSQPLPMKFIDSPYHQNENLKRSGKFYKAITRRYHFPLDRIG